MTNWGTGTPRREFLHVDDMADACLHLLEHYDGAQQVNVGTGKDATIREIAEVVAEVVGFEGETHWDTPSPTARRRSCSTSASSPRPDGPRGSGCARASRPPMRGTASTCTTCGSSCPQGVRPTTTRARPSRWTDASVPLTKTACPLVSSTSPVVAANVHLSLEAEHDLGAGGQLRGPVDLDHDQLELVDGWAEDGHAGGSGGTAPTEAVGSA